jgi:hypothetical protein
MKYKPERGTTPRDACPMHNFGGRRWDSAHENSGGMKHLRVLMLMWRLMKIFFRYGNQEIYYHVCGSIGEDAYDVPMDAENVEVRLTRCGPKVTIW